MKIPSFTHLSSEFPNRTENRSGGGEREGNLHSSLLMSHKTFLKQKTASWKFHYSQWIWLNEMAKVPCIALDIQFERLPVSHLQRLAEHLGGNAETLLLDAQLCKETETSYSVHLSPPFPQSKALEERMQIFCLNHCLPPARFFSLKHFWKCVDFDKRPDGDSCLPQ